MEKSRVLLLLICVVGLVTGLMLPHTQFPLDIQFLLVVGGLVSWIFLGLCPSAIDSVSLLPMAGFLFLLVPSMLVSTDGYLSLLAFSRLFAFTGYFASAVALGSSEGKEPYYLKIVLGAFTALFALIGLYEMFQPVQMPLHWAGAAQTNVLPFRISSLFINPNLWGAFATVILVTVTVLALTEVKLSNQIGLNILWALYAINLGCTFSRGSWLATILSLLVIGVVLWWHKISCPGKKTFVITFLITATVAAVLMYPYILSRVSTLSKPSEFGMQQRIFLYRGILSYAIEYLPFGSGVGTFSVVFPGFRLIGGQYVYEAHSDFLRFFAESGLFGVAGFLLFLAGFLLASCTRLIHERFFFVSFSCALAFAAAGNTVTFLHYSFLAVPLLVILGVCYGSGEKDQPFSVVSQLPGFRQMARRFRGNVFRGVTVAAALVSIVFWGLVYTIDGRLHSLGAQDLKNPDQLDHAIGELDFLVEVLPFRADLYYRRGQLSLSAVNGNGTDSQSHLDAALEDFHRAIALSPSESLYYRVMGDLFMKSGEFLSALKSYEEATKRDTHSVILAHRRAMALYRLNRTKEALDVLLQTLESDSGFMYINQESYRPVVELTITLLKQQNRYDEARQTREKYAKLFSSRKQD